MTDPWAAYPKVEGSAPAADPWAAYPKVEAPSPAPKSPVASAGAGTEAEDGGSVFGVANTMARNFLDDLLAGYQRTSPIVKNLLGEMNYKPLGDLIESDTGYSYADPATGKWVDVDGKRHVVLRDPDTGKMAVYERGGKTDEGLASAAGRVVGFGTLAGPPAATVGGIDAPVSRTVEAARAFDAAGVAPSIAAISPESRTAGIIQKSLDAVPGASSITGRATRRSAEQTEEAVGNLAGKYGDATSPEQAGRTVQKSTQQFVEAGERGEGMTDAEVIRAPTRSSGFDRKAAALFDRLDGRFSAEDAISVPSARGALTSALQRFDNPELGKEFVDKALGRWAGIVDNADGALTWNDLKQLRTEIGQKLRRPAVVDDIDRAQLKRVYAGLTEDMERAARMKGPEAERDFRRANDYYRAGMERINEALTPFLKADEGKILSMLQTAGDAKRPDTAKLLALKRSMDPEEWGDVASSIMVRLGQKAPSQADTLSDANFSATSFLTNFQRLSPQAKDALFSGPGLDPMRRDLDRLVKHVIGGQAAVEKLGNPSGTARTLTGTAIGAGAIADPVSTALSVLGGSAAAALMTSPNFTRWWAGTLRAPKNTATYVSQLERLARSERDAAPAIQELVRALRADGEESRDTKQ